MKQKRNVSYLNQNKTKLNYVIKFSSPKDSYSCYSYCLGLLLLVWISCVGQSRTSSFLRLWQRFLWLSSLYGRRSSGLPTLVPAANRYGVVIRLAQERYLLRTGPAASPSTFVAAVGFASTLSSTWSKIVPQGTGLVSIDGARRYLSAWTGLEGVRLGVSS